MKTSKALRLFLLVLAPDFAYSLFNFCISFAGRGDNLLSAAIRLLHFAPLAALTLLCANLWRIADRTRLVLIKKCLVAYPALDALLGLFALRFTLPRFWGFLFYARGWLFYAVYLVRYGQLGLAFNLALVALYWVAFGFLLAEISGRINQTNGLNDLENAASSETANGEKGARKISVSFKIAVASAILLFAQTAFNYYVHLVWNENNSGTGMQAIGIAFLAFILLAVKFIFSLPVVIPATVGIVQAYRQANRPLLRNRQGLWINIACLAISEIEVFLWW